MVAVLTCPSVTDLRRAMLGLNSDAEAASLEAHLEACPDCLEALHHLKADDSFTVACRSGLDLVEESSIDSSALHDLANHVWELARAADSRITALDSTSFGHSSPGRAAAPPAAQSESAHDFLAPPERPDEIGRLGGYRVLRVLGAGAMGMVFEAEDEPLQMRVALKVMLPHVAAFKEARTRFLSEAQAIAALQHDHVVGIFRFGEDRGVPFLVMPRLQGETVADRLRREKKLPLLEVLRIGTEVADGLAAAHARGRIHRDLKPSNLWLEAGKDRVKILDFGLVREMGDNKGLTQTNAIVGTVTYMAPEQIRGTVDARNDLHSLGCILYEVATGQLAFGGEQIVDVLDAKMHSTPRSPDLLDSALPADFSKLVMRLLEKDSNRRPQSATEVRQELLAITARITAGVELDPAADPLLSIAWTPSPLTAQPTGEVRPQGETDFRKSPPKVGRRTWLALASAAAAALLAVFYVSTDYGEVRIEVADAQPGAIVKVVGSRIEIKDGNKTVRLRPGVHGLTVEGDEFKVVPETFTLKRGPNDLVKVTLIPKQPQAPIVSGSTKSTPAGSTDWTWALVSQPTPLKGVSRWTIETAAHRGVILNFAFQPQGKLLATSGRDRTVRLWNLETGTLARILVGNDSSPRAFYHSNCYEGGALAWSRLGKLLAVASLSYPKQRNSTELSRIRIWNPETGTLVKQIDARTRIGAVAFAPDESTVASLEDGIVRVWNISTGGLVRQFLHAELPNLGATGTLLQFSPNGEYVAAAVAYHTGESPDRSRLAVWRVSDGTLVRSIDYSGNDTLPQSLDWSPDSRRLAVSPSYRAEVLDVASGTRTKLPGEMDRGCVRWLGDGSLLAGSRRFTNDLKQSEKVADKMPASWGWSAEGNRYVTLQRTGELEVYALGSDRPLLKTSTLGGDIREFVNVSQDGSTLVYSGAVWNLQSNSLVEEISGNAFGNIHSSVLLSSHGRALWTWNNGPLLGYDRGQKIAMNLLPKEFKALSLGDNPMGVYGLLKDRLVCLNPVDGQVLVQFEGTIGSIPTLTLSPDGKAVAASQPAGKVLVWDQIGKLRNTITTPDYHVTALSWSADGKRLAAATTPDNVFSTAMLLNAETGKLLHKHPFQTSVDRIAWSPDSRTVVFAGHQGETLELDADTGKPLVKANELEFVGGSYVLPQRHVRLGLSTPCAVQFWNYRQGCGAGNLVRLDSDQWLFVAPNGHYRSVPEELEQQIRYVAETAEGQQTFSPSEFRARFGWKNNSLQAEILSD